MHTTSTTVHGAPQPHSHPPLSELDVLLEEHTAIAAARHQAQAGDAAGRPSTNADPVPANDRARVIALLHAQRRTALCLSGGGIRSATFALGLIQGLSARGVLTEFDYLSTVSGGGYIGSWLSAWTRRSPNGIADVASALASTLQSHDNEQAARTRDPSADPYPVAHLRRFSNYLTPKLGLLSADTWTLAATYARNLIVNWLVFVPLILCVLMIPRLCIPCTAYDAGAGLIVAMMFLGLTLVITGLTVTGLSVPSVAFPKRHIDASTPAGRSRIAWLGQGGFLRGVFAPLSAAATCLTVAWAWYRAGWPGPDSLPPAWAFVIGGIAVYFATFLCTWILGHRKSLELNVEGYLKLADLLIFSVVGATAGYLTYVVAVVVFPNPRESAIAYTCLSAPLVLAIHFLAGTFYVACKSRTSDPRDDEDREWWARAAGWLLVAIGVWSLFSLLVLIGPRVLMRDFWAAVLPVGGLSGLVTMFLSSSSATPSVRKDRGNKGLQSVLINAALALAAPLFIAFLIAGMSMLTDILLTHRIPADWDEHARSLLDPKMGRMLAYTAGLLAFGLGMARLINLNKFSMHALYRNRLIRGYLGASRQREPNPFTGFDADDNLQMYNLRSRPRDGAPPLSEVHLADVSGLYMKLRDPSHWLSARIWPRCERARAIPLGSEGSVEARSALLEDLNALVTGDYLCDANHDHLPSGVLDRVGPPQGPTSPGDPDRTDRNRHLLEHVFPEHILPGSQRPMHVVNIALNLVAGEQLAWQERKAESFTVTALHSGSSRLGYRRSLAYGGQDGISLGTAVAISGAAASPNSGYHSSPPLALLMTIFNVRLGWWLGNPKDEGASRASAPLLSIAPVVNEAFGLTDERSSSVYLSDGGHFENLGLYEMVRRRCRVIVLSDGGCDPACTFEDLGNAIRKIRIDLGIEITIDTSCLYARDNDRAPEGKYCAIGTIGYRAADGPGFEDGVLLYIKPTVRGSEPTDVRNYASVHPTFPHESTGDQWFSESQFESYRALGHHAIETIWQGDSEDLPPNDTDPIGIERLVLRARQHAVAASPHDSGRFREFFRWARAFMDPHLVPPSDGTPTSAAPSSPSERPAKPSSRGDGSPRARKPK